MAHTPLVMQLIREGQRLISLLDVAQFRVIAAFWWYSAEADRWMLVIATPRVLEVGPRAAYTELFEIVRKLRPSIRTIGYSDITLVDPPDPLVMLLDSYFRRSGLHELPAGDTGPQAVISGQSIEGAYVYRLPSVDRLRRPATNEGG